MYYTFSESIYEQYGVSQDPPHLREVSFMKGAWISQPLHPPFTFTATNTSAHPPPDFTGATIPIMSQAMVSALQAAGVDNLQLFPARLENPKTVEGWDGYYAVNILGLVACADLDASEYGKIGARLYEFDKLVVKQSSTRDLLLFRLAESPRIILAHEEVVQSIISYSTPKLRGYFLEPVQMS